MYWSFFSAVQNRFLPSRWTVYLPCFPLISTVSKRLNTVTMHALETLFSLVSAVLKRFKYLHNACFRDIISNIFSLQFPIVSYTARMHAVGTLVSTCSLKLQIVSNTARMHALKTFCISVSVCYVFLSNLTIILRCARKEYHKEK